MVVFSRNKLCMSGSSHERKKYNKKNKSNKKSPQRHIQEYSFDDFLSDVGNKGIRQLFENRLARAKLNASQPGDEYEQEADRIANRVTSGDFIDPEQVKKAAPLQKKESASPSIPSVTEARISSLKGKGNPLDASVKNYLEPRFGVDLGNVRIHTDADANRLSRAIHAKAFTVGNDIAFAQGQYSPGTLEGEKLIAHELTHTIQQRDSHTVQRAPDRYALTDEIYELQKTPESLIETLDYFQRNILPASGMSMYEIAERYPLYMAMINIATNYYPPESWICDTETQIGLAMVRNTYRYGVSSGDLKIYPIDIEFLIEFYTDHPPMTISEQLHLLLDIIGLIPGFGEVADGINAIFYAIEGDYVTAGISAAAMLPIAGWVATGGKVVKRGLVKGAKVAAEVFGKALKEVTEGIAQELIVRYSKKIGSEVFEKMSREAFDRYVRVCVENYTKTSAERIAMQGSTSITKESIEKISNETLEEIIQKKVDDLIALTSKYSKEFIEWLHKGPVGTKVYIGLDVLTEKPAYVGITVDIARRQGEHQLKYNIKAITDFMTRHEARCIEQYVISQRWGIYDNAINSIAKDRSIYAEAVRWGKEAFEKLEDVFDW